MGKRLFILLFALLLTFLFVKNLPQNSVSAQTSYEYYFPFFPLHAGFGEFSTIGPDGGTVTAIAIDPTNPDIVYAGTWGHGVYKSQNGGGRWNHQSEGFRSGFVFDLAIDPDNHQHILASAYRYGAYESFNGGETWQKTSGMPEETVVYSFAFHPENSDLVYAAVRLKTVYNPSPHYPGAVYKSTDGGSNWVKQSQGLPDDYVYDVAIDPNHPNVLYTAMHETGVYKSVDGADNWTSVNNNIHYRDVRSLDINPNNSTIYAGMYDGKGAAYSTNGGESWSTIHSSVSQALYVYRLQLDPHDQKSLYLNTPDGLFQCKDSTYPSSQTACERIAHDNRYVFALALDQDSAASTGKIQKFYTGLQTYGLHKSTNAGQDFSASYTGLKSNVILSILNDPEAPGTLYASVLGRGVFKSTDYGQNWQAIRDGMPSPNINHLIFRPGNSRVLYAGTQDGGIYVTTNAGGSWSAANSGITQSVDVAVGGEAQFENTSFGHSSYSWMDPVDREALSVSAEGEKAAVRSSYPEILTIQINPENPTQMIAGTAGKGVLKSNDSGQTWVTTELTWGEIYDAIVDLRQPLIKFHIGVLDAGIRGSDTVRTSWPARNAGFHPGADVYGLARGVSGKYFAASDKGIYQTNNAGGTWSLVGLSNIRFNDIFVDPDRPAEIWAASSDGLYRSLDGGGNWELVDDQRLNNQFLTITRGVGGHQLFIGMSGGNIVRIEK